MTQTDVVEMITEIVQQMNLLEVVMIIENGLNSDPQSTFNCKTHLILNLLRNVLFVEYLRRLTLLHIGVKRLSKMAEKNRFTFVNRFFLFIDLV